MKIFNLPDLGEGLAEAEVREWYVKEGDTVSVDQPLLSMETAKAVVDVPSPYAGKISKLYGQIGDRIPTHSPLVDFEGEKDKGSVVGNLEISDSTLTEDSIIGSMTSSSTTSVKALPAVRALAKKLNIDISKVKASGSKGEITAEDIHNHAHPIKEGEKKFPLSGVRLSMAKAMVASHQDVVSVTIYDDADITHFTSKTDLTVAVIQALIAGVKAEPALNAWLDSTTLIRTFHDEVNLGLAVDTDEGLFVPVIKNISQKSAKKIREEINYVKVAARDRVLKPDEFHGATITLSNFGIYAGRYASVVVVPPMVAILGCGKIREAVLPYHGEVAIRRVLPLSLSFDHRAVTGGEATRFLAAVIKALETM